MAPEKYMGSAPNAVIMIHVRETMRVASFVPMFSSFLFHVKAIAIKETASIRIIVLRNPIMESYSSDETAMKSGTSITRAMKSMMNARNRITDRQSIFTAASEPPHKYYHKRKNANQYDLLSGFPSEGS